MFTLYVTEAYYNPKLHINKFLGVHNSKHIEHIKQEVGSVKEKTDHEIKAKAETQSGKERCVIFLHMHY